MRVSARGALLCSAILFVAIVAGRAIALPNYGNAFTDAAPLHGRSAEYGNWWNYHVLQGDQCKACHGSATDNTQSKGNLNGYGVAFATINGIDPAQPDPAYSTSWQLPPDVGNPDGDLYSDGSPYRNIDEITSAARTFPGIAEATPPTAPNSPPVAVDDGPGSGFTTNEDTAFTTASLTGNDTDPDGDTRTIQSVDPTSAKGASVSVASSTTARYDPAGKFESLGAGASTTDTFNYVVTDGKGGQDTGQVTITINGVNDAPTAVDDSGNGFASSSRAQFTTASVLTNDTDPDNGDTKTFVSLDTTGTKGIVTSNGDGTFNYNPNGQFDSLAPGATDTDVFHYTMRDAAGLTSTATVTITLTGSPNNAPIARDDSGAGFTTNEDTAFTTASVKLNDQDPDGDPLAVSLDTSGTIGQVTVNADGTLNYNPNGKFEGLTSQQTATDVIHYTISDGRGGTASATVTITITGVADAPIAKPDIASTAYNTPVTVDVTANDVSAAPFTSVQVVQNPSHGTAVPSGLRIIYTPAAGYSGPDSFAYTVTSDGKTSLPAIVSITVQPRPGFRAGAIANATHDEALKSTAQTLDNVCVTLNGTVTRSSDQSTLYAVCRGLETDATANRSIDPALGSIRNEEAFAATDSSFDIARGISGNLESRLDLLRTPHAAATVDVSHFNLRAGNSAGFSMLQSRLMNALNSGLNQAVGSADHPDRPWGVWAAGDFQAARRDDGSAGGSRKSNTQSVTGGFDYRFGDNFVAGMALSYSKLDSSFRTSPGDFDAKGLVYSVYGSGSVGPATIDGHVSVAQNSFDLRRTIKFTTAETTTDVIARAHFRGRDYLAGVRGWLPFHMNNVTVAVEGGGLFLWSRVDPYIETGAGAFDLSVRQEHEKLIIGNLGLEGSTRFDLGNFVLTPRIEAKYHVASGRDNRTITSSFVADPLDRATIVLLSNADSDQRFYSTNLGLTMSTRRITAEIEYISIWGLKNFKSNQFVVNLSFPF